MNIFFDPTGSPEGLSSSLEKVTAEGSGRALLLLCCDANGFTPANIDPVLHDCPLPLIGGIFPGIIYNNRMYERGSLVVELDKTIKTRTIHDLSGETTDFEKLLEEDIEETESGHTLILFVDGFAKNISAFIDSLFNVFGFNFNYIGGGAGSMRLERDKYILTNEGLQEDCAVLAFLESESGIGVSHGWQEIAGPYQITESSDNIINTIEWQPAFQFYQQVLREKSGVQISREKFFDVAKYYPFGVSRIGGEQIVRDPYIILPDDSMACVGEVPEGAFISVLGGNENNLIAAAKETVELSRRGFPPDRQPALNFFVDCISRVLVLGDNFGKEIDAVYSGDLPLIGVCSMGEIANSGTEYIELYNKTAVMAILE